jgi:hypothetical protein
MMFTKRLREPVRRGEVTCSVPPGEIEVTRLVEIDLGDVTEDLARRGGFADLDDLMSIARHGRGERVFLVEFRYVEAK